jgi:hypothetical protein
MADKNEERRNEENNGIRFLFSYLATLTEMAVPQGGSRPSYVKKFRLSERSEFSEF